MKFGVKFFRSLQLVVFFLGFGISWSFGSFNNALAGNPQDSSTKKTIGMTFTTPPDLKVGDEVETTTVIRVYDIVCWERVGKNKWIMRALSPQEASTYEGRKFQIFKGDEAGTVKYIEIE